MVAVWLGRLRRRGGPDHRLLCDSGGVCAAGAGGSSFLRGRLGRGVGAHPASPPVPLVPPLPRRAGANRRGAAGARRPRRQDAVGLPPGLTCIRFVVQWYWATANSCTPGMGAYAFPVACGDCPGNGRSRGGIVRGAPAYGTVGWGVTRGVLVVRGGRAGGGASGRVSQAGRGRVPTGGATTPPGGRPH